MESLPSGGSLASHLAAVRRAVLDWLEYETPEPTQAGQDEYLLRLALDNDLTTPEMPEVLQLLRESRELNVPIFNGSLMDMPYVFHLELSTCLAAEKEFRAIRMANKRNQEMWDASLSARTQAPED